MNRRFANSAQERRAAEKHLLSLSEKEQHECTHGADCNAETILLHGSGIYAKKIEAKYNSDAVVCTGCKQIYSSTSFSPSDLEASSYMNRSILEQIKHVANLPDADWDMIMKAYDALDIIDRVHVYYCDMINKLASDGKSKKQKENRKRNLFGVDASLFGTSRDY